MRFMEESIGGWTRIAILRGAVTKERSSFSIDLQITTYSC